MSGVPGEGMTAVVAVERLLAAVETAGEGGVLTDLLVRAGLAKECGACGEVHRQAGERCIACADAAVSAGRAGE